MSVIDLPIAGITPTQTEPKSQANTTSSETGDTSFSTILENLTNPTVSVTDKCLASDISHTMALPDCNFINPDQLLSAALSGGSEDLINQLSEHLLSFAGQLLNGGRVDMEMEGLNPILNEILGGLRQNSAEGQNELLKLFISIKDMASSGSLKGKVEGLVNELPDSIKLKIRSNTQGNKVSTRDHGLDLIRDLLVANLFVSIKSDALGQIESDASGIVRIHGRVMSKLAFPVSSSSADSALGQLDLATSQPEISGSMLAEIEESVPSTQIGYAKNSDDNDPEKVLSGMQQTDDGSNADVESILKKLGLNREEVNAAAKSQPEAWSENQPEVEVKIQPDVIAKGQSVESNSLQSSYGNLGTNRTPMSQGVSQISSTIYGSQEASTGNAITNSTQLLNQVKGQFDILIAEGRSEATIKLKPEQLGELKIHLVLENGAIKAVLDASTSQVKEMLEANLSNLKSSLENQGIQVKEFNVSVGQHETNHNRSNYRRHRRSLTLIHDRAMDLTEIQRIRPSMILSGDMVVNYLA